MVRGELLAFAVLASFSSGCGVQDEPKNTDPRPESSLHDLSKPLGYPAVDDLVRHDTLLIQTTFDLGDGTFVMVASHTDASNDDEQEERTAGLRLYRFRPAADSSAEVIAVSSPGHDSWTLFPTFFKDPLHQDALILVANTGDRDSWGQKVYRLDDRGFHDLGFIDAALPERVEGSESGEIRLRNLGPQVRCTNKGGDLVLQFACDSILLYDDLRGGLEQIVPASSVQYIAPKGNKLELWIHGERRIDPMAS